MRRVSSQCMHRAIGGHRNSWVDRLSTQMIHNIDGQIGRQTGRQAGRHRLSAVHGLWNDPKSDTVTLMRHGLELVARPF